MMVYQSLYQTPIGIMIGAAKDDAVIGLWFEGQRYFPAHTNDWTKHDAYPVLQKLGCWLDAYFQRKKPDINFSLAPCGSDFQQAVWAILHTIPYGQTTTYGEIARRVNTEPSSARAVGGAVGHNPISIVVPCHRVVGANGNLTGYAGGLNHKIALLRLEGALL